MDDYEDLDIRDLSVSKRAAGETKIKFTSIHKERVEAYFKDRGMDIIYLGNNGVGCSLFQFSLLEEENVRKPKSNFDFIQTPIVTSQGSSYSYESAYLEYKNLSAFPMINNILKKEMFNLSIDVSLTLKQEQEKEDERKRKMLEAFLHKRFDEVI